MVAAIRQFLFVTFVVLSVSFFAWVYLRQKGLSEPRFAFEHPFLKAARPLLVYRPEKLEPSTPATWISWVNVDLKNLDQSLAQIRSLPDDRKFILNVLDYPPDADAPFAETLRAKKSAENFLILSPVAGLLTDLRKIDAGFLFGNSSPLNVRLQMMGAIGLASAAKIRADVYIAWGEKKNELAISDSILNELIRRKIPVLAGPIDDTTVANAWSSKGISGFISPSSEFLRSLAPASQVSSSSN